ncbi:adenosine deaminase [Hyphopichia burtonii NRRL Y-1933]|uniref:Adenosine deaminase n=1 Tax=Hyphopichia burtonii NRRL Y-1933 TaxID=984485 RepID=A0A1E4RPD1_9ASCO|nr:adenosine deaminase [Hyphopichia burtonii NRRL Y-1933]ODV69117.1 adenosine deaminase [Hyphopichia burtonii NRRL Y-1933]
MDFDLEQFCHGIPKIELHCHLYGTIRKNTFIDLNKAAGSPLNKQEIEEFYFRGEKPIGVLRIFRALDQYLIRSPNDLYRITSEYLEFAHLHNVHYTEFFWNPTGTVKVSKIPYLDATNGILKAMKDNEHKIKSRLINSIDREASSESATEMVTWMIENKNPLVIGIGIDYRETLGPPGNFIEAYNLAKNAGLKCTAHAGEFGCPSSYIKTAVEDLKVDRIDHGYTVLEDELLLEACKLKNLIFTVVPSNSYYLRTLSPDEWAKKHPIRFMKSKGLKIFPNTDDPAFHQVTPTKSWMMMVECFDYTINDLQEFVLNSIEAAWLNNEELKEEWRTRCNNYFESQKSVHQ